MLKMIIVDDEKIIRETIHSLIDWNSLGIDVAAVCKDGIEAFDCILDEYPDIVMTDIKMPGLSGLDLIEKVRAAQLNTEFIILSGYGEFEFARTAMRYGCSRSKFLSKLLKTFDKTFREIFPVFISTKRREKPSAFFDNNFVNNAYFSEAASSSSSHLASSSSKAPISSRMTCLCLWSS